MQAMTAREFTDTITLPTVLEFRADPRSRRRAYLACVATFHLKDYLKAAGEKGIEVALRAQIGSYFDVVRAVCNGAKHGKTNDSHPISFEAGTDWDRPPATCDDLECDVSELGDEIGGRDIASGDGSADLYVACAQVLRAYMMLYPQHLAGCDLSGL